MANDLKPGPGADHDRPERGYHALPVLKTPVWRWEIWSYFVLGGLAAGSFIVASLARLFGEEDDRGITRCGYLISFAAILGCPPLLIKDLGRPARFLNMLRVFKPGSPMSMGVWGLIGFSACSGLAACRDLLGSSETLLGSLARKIPARIVAVTGTGLGTFLGGYTGILLSVTSVPLWSRSRLLGPIFLASAWSSSLSAISLALVAAGRDAPSSRDKLNRAKLAAIVGEVLALIGYLRTTGRAAKPITAPEQYGRHFVAGAIGLGLAVPLCAILAGSKRRSSSVLASLAALAGSIFLRYAIVEGGRLSAQDPAVTFWHTDIPEWKDDR